jgi:DNA-binding transcriptional LysR family regulator
MTIPHSPHSAPTLRELEVLRAMMATRKTVAAASMLGISQPAISRTIATLEEKLGRSLFTRSGGRLIPTADAFTLEAEASPIFSALERLSSWPSQPSQGGLLRIATSPTLGHCLLPEIIASFRMLEPEAVIGIDIVTSNETIAAVADRRADIGIVDNPADHLAVRTETFREAISHVIMPSNDPLADKPRIFVPDISERPLIALASRFAARAELERVFATHGKSLKVTVEVSTSTLAAELVRAGVGITMVNPFPISINGLHGLVARPFSPTISYRTCMLFPATGPVSALARRFSQHLKMVQSEDRITIPIR